MKVIKYNLRTLVKRNIGENSDWMELLTPVEMDWCEANERVAMKEAADGIYHIENDDQ